MKTTLPFSLPKSDQGFWLNLKYLVEESITCRRLMARKNRMVLILFCLDHKACLESLFFVPVYNLYIALFRASYHRVFDGNQQ